MSAKTTNKKAAVSDRKTHSWSESELRYIAERPSMPRAELIEGFRKEFPGFTGSDTAITGRRFRILRDGSSKHPELGGTALAARVEQLKHELPLNRTPDFILHVRSFLRRHGDRAFSPRSA